VIGAIKLLLQSWASTTYFCQIVEAALVCALVLLGLLRPELGSRWFERLERGLRQLSEHRVVSFTLIAACVILVRLSLVTLLPPPKPSIHDEFSYLLAAETYSSGKLTNAPDPFWPHYESVHILQQPTYMSMYPPGQGLFLAVGIAVAKSPWAGVIFSVALLFAALHWALLGWIPSRWALMMTLMAVIRWGLVSYWINSYWGGAVPALGGALVFGSVPRLVKKIRVRDTVALACGMVLLANTRPYEGLAVIVSLFVILILWASRSGTLVHLRRPRIWIPVFAILMSAGAAMLFYNRRVTNSAVVLPYLLDRKQYAIAPLFVWQHTRPAPKYNSLSLRDVYLAELGRYHAAREGMGIPEIFRKLKNIWIFYFGPLFSIPLIAFISTRSKWTSEERSKARYFTIVLLALLITLFQVVWFYPHYAAPGFAAAVAMLAFGFRNLRFWCWHERPTGLFLSRTIPIGCVLMATIPIAAHPLGWRLSAWPLQWALGSPAAVQTDEIKSRVLTAGQKALVFVQYGPNHDPADEWVYNAPWVDKSPIIWARKVSPESDAVLIRHYPDRTVWLVKTDTHPRALLRAPDSVHSSGYWDELMR
jgi:hypothetical protein